MRDENVIDELIAEARDWSARAHQTLQAKGEDAARTGAYGRYDELAAAYGETAWELLDGLLAALSGSPRSVVIRRTTEAGQRKDDEALVETSNDIALRGSGW